MQKTYAERYGVDAVKKHLRNGTRYFKLCSDYANGGIRLFDAAKFAGDVGANLLTFPFRMSEQNGWKLRAVPTDAELDSFLAIRSQ